MAMQLENNGFTVIEDVLSKEVLDILEPYAKLLPTDKSSYDVWPDASTNNKTAPECFTSDVLGKDRIQIINELYNNQKLPCFGKSWIKDSDIAIQKIPTGGFIPKHNDYCKFSLTVFLAVVEGGEFVWWDENNIKHIVETKYNRGVAANGESFRRGFDHKVMPVTNGCRFTLQLFVFDKKTRSEKQGAIILEDLENE